VDAKRFIIPIFISHHGCPHRCVFCNQNSIAHPASTIPTLEEVTEEIERYLRLGSRRRRDDRTVQVAFYGGSFTALPLGTQKGLLHHCEPFLNEGIVHSLRVSTRPDAIFPECLQILTAHRVATVELGVQSMADEVLKTSLRGYGKERVKEAVRELQKEGLEVGIQLMIGLPGDSAEQFTATVEEVIQLNPHFVRLYPTIVIHGTILEQWFREGRYHPLSLEEAVTLAKEALKRLHQARIPVIRIGLQPTPSLEAPGTIVAGPYHPAFRQLAEGMLLYERAVDLLAEFLNAGGVIPTFLVSPRDISTFYGQGKQNILKLRKTFDLPEIRVQPDLRQQRGTISLCE
jgi:histone acetyltransferase (RNA polymerase elongator complex component)